MDLRRAGDVSTRCCEATGESFSELVQTTRFELLIFSPSPLTSVWISVYDEVIHEIGSEMRRTLSVAQVGMSVHKNILHQC